MKRLSVVLFFVAFALSFPLYSQEKESVNPFESWNENNLVNLQKLSSKLVRDFRGKNDDQRKKDFDELCKLANDNSLAPAIRYNAILTIGQLEAKDAKPPVGYVPALKYLTDVFQKSTEPSYLRYGALLGIRWFSYTDELTGKDTLAKILAESLSQAHDADKDVAIDFRVKALEGLAGLKFLDAGISQSLFNIMTEKNNRDEYVHSIAVRAGAVKVFGDIDYKENKADTKVIVDSLLTFAKGTCQEGIEKLNAAEMKNINTRYSGGQYGTGNRMTDSQKKAEQRRRDNEAKRKTYSSLTLDEKELVQTTIIDTKIALQSVLWAFNGEKNAGIRGSLKDDDRTVKDIDNTTKEIKTLFKTLEEGEGDTNPMGSRSPGGAGTGRSSRDRDNPSGAPALREKYVPKEFAINVYYLKEALTTTFKALGGKEDQIKVEEEAADENGNPAADVDSGLEK